MRLSINRSQNGPDIVVFLLLITIGVVGRWFQPEWSFTPISAIAVFAGYYFARLSVALMVPIASLAISDLALPAYDHNMVFAATYLAMLLPVCLGRTLRHDGSRVSRIMRWSMCGLVPAMVFFIATNFAVWAFKSTYDKTLAGLVECYVAAIPFFRWMIAGDIFYLCVVFGCYALAMHEVKRSAPSGVRSREQV